MISSSSSEIDWLQEVENLEWTRGGDKFLRLGMSANVEHRAGKEDA